MQSSLYLLQREADFIKAGERSFKSHLDYLEKLQREEHDSATNQQLTDEISDMDQEMEALNKELAEICETRRQTSDKKASLAQSVFQSRLVRDAMTERLNRLANESSLVSDQIASLEDETLRVVATLDRAKQLNTMNDAFYIWYAGPFATINSFRLGSLTNKPIDSTEINAALGQAALVVHIISQRAGVEMRHFTITPMGSFPKIGRVDDKRTSYPLFIDSSSFTLFPKRNFNLALQGFMSCLAELGDYIANHDPTLSLPYKISVHDSKIGDLSFVYGSEDEVWTRALKFMLSDIKWVIAWYCKHCSNLTDTHGIVGAK